MGLWNALQLDNSSQISYQSTGDGFPLVLVPGAEGIAHWLPHTPLLSELCQVIAYEGCQPQSALEFLPDILDALRLERIYLASPFPEWLPALGVRLPTPSVTGGCAPGGISGI